MICHHALPIWCCSPHRGDWQNALKHALLSHTKCRYWQRRQDFPLKVQSNVFTAMGGKSLDSCCCIRIEACKIHYCMHSYLILSACINLAGALKGKVLIPEACDCSSHRRALQCTHPVSYFMHVFEQKKSDCTLRGKS